MRAMKPSLITLPKIYADWSTIGWAMVLGYAPKPTDMQANGKPAMREAVKDWEGEGGTLKETSQTKAARKSAARKPAKRKPKRKPTPIKAPGKKRAPMKKKRTRR
jgi:hypothetical protein